ncbi:GatB/GatE catalytic domain-containing protein [Dipodascopsis tothii]|uniref:GatB/GatE catalytic domain-containing protein n=1 Tax=Dipodascopsis tothii TaxID=44089 RepID=UPI0034CDE367
MFGVRVFRSVWNGGHSRAYSTSYDQLMCGLEIHVQLDTTKKLFSAARTSFHALPNSQVSYYDAALPGTQPTLNKHALYLALKAATALDCDIHARSAWDRKHYFYGDQPAGYQITQHYHPLANNGRLLLHKHDGEQQDDVSVRIAQIQIEQDTGKSTYPPDSTLAFIDLNRTNHPLIEIVTEPDICHPRTAGVFVRKLQTLLKHLKVSTGELQSGAMRVDVNVSVRGGKRCEIKNLASIRDVTQAIEVEYNRQLAELAAGRPVESETRSWDGQNTWRLRSKETTLEYRYMPDPELAPIILTPTLLTEVKKSLPELPDVILEKLMSPPHDIILKDARTLLSRGLVEYYMGTCSLLQSAGVRPKIAANWIANEILGLVEDTDNSFTRKLSPQTLADVLVALDTKVITKENAKLLIEEYINNGETDSVNDLIDRYDLRTNNTALESTCLEVIGKFPKEVNMFVSGKKPKIINFLVGQVMRLEYGKYDAKTTEALLIELINKSK